MLACWRKRLGGDFGNSKLVGLEEFSVSLFAVVLVEGGGDGRFIIIDNVIAGMIDLDTLYARQYYLSPLTP